MKKEAYERVGWLVTTVVAFGVGVFLGGRACAPEPVTTEKIVVQEQVVEVCRNDCEDPKPEPPEDHGLERVEREAQKLPENELPRADRPTVPAQRKKLLAWVKDQSRQDLEECRTSLADVARVTVSVTFRDGRTPRVTINAAEDELPASVRQCVQRRVALWRYPDGLVDGQNEILFGLRL